MPRSTKKILAPKEQTAAADNSADNAVLTAVKQVNAGLLFKQPRMERIKAIEDMYAMKERPALVGRYAVPFDGVVMRGYMDTLMSKVDDTSKLVFKSDNKESGYKAAKKITSA